MGCARGVDVFTEGAAPSLLAPKRRIYEGKFYLPENTYLLSFGTSRGDKRVLITLRTSMSPTDVTRQRSSDWPNFVSSPLFSSKTMFHLGTDLRVWPELV